MPELQTLDTIATKALQFFIDTPPPQFDVTQYSLPLVVGSGNAYATGTILFAKQAAFFADESNFKKVTAAYAPLIQKKLITQAVIISASGEKDSVWEIEHAQSLGLHTTLLTCSAESTAAALADTVLVYRKIDEPYTYNTSTYLGMILSATHEDPENILNTIQSLAIPELFGAYEAYAFVVPDEFSEICQMLDTKRNELFGPKVSIRSFPQGHARHAKFVIPTDKELVIGINTPIDYYGKKEHQYQLHLPAESNFGLIMALTYYLCGKIQLSKPPYFMDNIENYCLDYGPKAYGKPGVFEVIVPGN